MLTIWTNDDDYVVAASAKDASVLFLESEFSDADALPDENGPDAWVSWPSLTINWSDECGTNTYRERLVTELCAEHGRGYLGGNYC